MRRKKSNLDEMQEQELLKVEHNGCWIVFWGPAGRDHHTKHPVWKPRLHRQERMHLKLRDEQNHCYDGNYECNDQWETSYTRPSFLLCSFPKNNQDLMCFAQCCWIDRYRIRVIFLNTLTSVFATVDMVLINISKATPTTSFRVSPTVSPVTAAL